MPTIPSAKKCALSLFKKTSHYSKSLSSHEEKLIEPISVTKYPSNILSVTIGRKKRLSRSKRIQSLQLPEGSSPKVPNKYSQQPNIFKTNAPSIKVNDHLENLSRNLHDYEVSEEKVLCYDELESPGCVEISYDNVFETALHERSDRLPDVVSPSITEQLCTYFLPFSSYNFRSLYMWILFISVK